MNGPLRTDVAKTFQISEETFEEFRKEVEPQLLLGTMTERAYWEELVRRTHSTQPIPEESLLAREYAKHFSIDQGVLSIVKELKVRGIRLGCLTDTQRPHTEFNIRTGLYDEFEVQIFSHDVGMVKPDPRIYVLALERTGSVAAETFYIDNKPENLIPAKDLGMTGIFFQGAAQLRRDLEQLQVLS